jgi:sulfite reductase alpha subunit-like flavoprotein
MLMQGALARTAPSASSAVGTPSKPAPAETADHKNSLISSNSASSATTEKPGGPAGQTTPPPAASTGGAAILARLRQQREVSAAAAKRKADEDAARLPITILYASQTGTAEEIAHSLYDEAVQKGLKANVASMNAWTFANICPEKSPVLIVVAASTGDGDAPDNSSQCVLALKMASGEGQFKGVKFTVLGLGDSNYTKFMEVSRVIRRKFIEMGAVELYASGEADEVDGLEDVVDAWRDGLWEPLLEAAAPEVCCAPNLALHLGLNRAVQCYHDATRYSIVRHTFWLPKKLSRQLNNLLHLSFA